MKTHRLPNLMIAALCFAALFTAGCTEKTKVAEAPAPPVKEVAKTPATTAVPEPATTVQVAIATPSPQTAPADTPAAAVVPAPQDAPAASSDAAAVAAPPAAPAPSTAVAVVVSPPVAPMVSPDATPASWSDIKDYTYDMRVQFLAGLSQLGAKVEAQVAELTAKRAAMTSASDTKDWDFAMKEMIDSQSALKSIGEDLSKATPETWDQLKDRVGQAWVRTQDAYGKVKSSTTS